MLVVSVIVLVVTRATDAQSQTQHVAGALVPILMYAWIGAWLAYVKRLQWLKTQAREVI